MVLQKRLDYGSSGYQVPAMPHFPTSAKGKRSIRKKVDSQMCPFDLLATVAGQLLSERENSVLFPQCINGTSNATNTRRVTIEEEQVCKRDPFKTEAFHEQSCNDNALGPEIIAKGQITCGLKEHSQASGPADSGPASLLIKSDISDATTGELMNINDRAQIGYPANAVAGTGGIRRNPPAFAKVQGEGMTRPPEYENQSPGNGLELNALHMYSLEVPMDLDARPPASISSDSSAGVPVCRNYVPGTSSLPKHESGLELVVDRDRDDDDNSSGCTHPGNITNQASRPQYIGDHGVRKLSTSKYWKADPSTLKYSEVSNYDVKTKHGFCGKKICYTRQRTHRSYFNRRKLFERHSVSASNGGIFSEDISNLCEKIGINVEAHDPHATVHTTVVSADGASSSKIGQNSSFDSVKLSIKSFKVPELFIEIPESATVGSLKRTVMEAVTAILQGGLHVGVLLQGKKVRDDNKTLRQAGISHSDKLDNLGFTLEPSLSRTPPPLTSTGDPHFLCIGDAVEPLARIPPIAHSVDWEACNTSPQPALTSCPESDHDSVHSPTDASSLDQTRANSRALVALPAVSVEALAVVPLRKPRRPEHVQRRIRRPFSVTEAEALVQAVEKLGTGRWRDVKLRAFDNAKHRTYVDLKDKWKTLVHTARISPQQRRGEPVPQELLDRVLSAQAYWSQRQAKLHVRPPADDETCLLL